MVELDLSIAYMIPYGVYSMASCSMNERRQKAGPGIKVEVDRKEQTHFLDAYAIARGLASGTLKTSDINSLEGNSRPLTAGSPLSATTNAFNVAGVNPSALTAGSGHISILGENGDAASPGTPVTGLPQRSARPSVEGIMSSHDLGALVRTAREAMGLTQQRFADLSGVGRRFVSELENGKETAELGKVLMVCRAAGIDVFARRR